MDVSINISSLWAFYKRHKVNYYKSSVTYSQAENNVLLPSMRLRFALELGRLIAL